MSSNSSRKTWSLVADIGGTNARFARKLPGSNQLVDHTTFNVAEFDNFSQGFSEALTIMQGNQTWASMPAAACLAVACRVDDEEISLLNSHWHFKRSDLKALLKGVHLDLINDFAATGYGIRELTPDDWLQVGGMTPFVDRPAVILGPGTGLGVSLLIPHGKEFTVVDGEGGHVDFSPVDQLDLQVLALLQQRFGRVSAERLLCGAGLINIYQAIARIRDEPCLLTTAESVTDHGLRGADVLAEETLKLFCRGLGSVAGNLALITGALGGVYITGGIIPKMLDFFVASEFRERFEAKGRYADYLSTIPVRVVTRNDPGLLGAANRLTMTGH